MHHNVDVHVAMLPCVRPAWRDECLASLDDEPCNVHVVDGVEGHIGQARLRGFQQGTAPYVSFADPDDYVLPGAIKECVKVLQENINLCGVYTHEKVKRFGGPPRRVKAISPWDAMEQYMKPKRMHHLLVMRRDFVERHYKNLAAWPHMPNYLLAAAIARYAPWRHVDIYGYIWRDHMAGAHLSYTRREIENVMTEAAFMLLEAKRKWQQ